MRAVLIVLLLLVGAHFITRVVADKPPSSVAASSERTSPSSTAPISNEPAIATPARATDVEAPPVALPSAERAFLDAIGKSREAYGAAENDMRKGAQRSVRRRALCRSGGGQVNNWIGKVVKLSTNGDGKGILAIEVGQDITLSTWNNDLSDFKHRTLIDPDGHLFDTVSTLKEGDKVRFSGRLFPSPTDCFFEMSMTIGGSMSAPEFVTRFSEVEKVN